MLIPRFVRGNAKCDSGEYYDGCLVTFWAIYADELSWVMDDWLASLKDGSDVQNVLSGQHTWHPSSHARPTYCNVCREQLSGVTSHGLSCEICKYKVHKRCAPKTINNCKWTTLSSVGKDIIEDRHGNVLMPHQWMEGNLPVSAKCVVCEKTCGSVLRLQDWRCIWCRVTVHTACRPKHPVVCPLSQVRLSVLPPTAIHSVGQDESWEAVRPQGCSPLLVFVNSKSGDNQGVKFLKRFRQILNPVQVFDLIVSGPGLGLRLFRNFDPFRVLVCSGDGSVGWVLSEIDRLNMLHQCEVGVLPLGTGNDLSRVLGWGASCDDDAHLPQLLERYERATPKLLDRWSIMVLEKSVKLDDGAEIKLNREFPEESGKILSTAVAYEDSVLTHLAQILQSDEHSAVISSAKVLCESVKDFSAKISEVSMVQGDEEFSKKCDQLKLKLNHLCNTLQEEQQTVTSAEEQDATPSTSSELATPDEEKHTQDIPEKSLREKKPRRDKLLLRINSLKKAVRNIVEYTEKVVDEQNLQCQNFLCPSTPGSKRGSSRSIITLKDETSPKSPVSPLSLYPSVVSLSPLPDVRRDSAFSNELVLGSLPVPSEFADSRHGSFATERRQRFSYDNTSSYEEYVNVKFSEDWIKTEDEHSLDEKDVDFSDYGETIFSREPSTPFQGPEDVLSHIGHIDSSETSDSSAESLSEAKKEEEEPQLKVTGITKSSLRESIKSERSCPISIDGICTAGSELDLTNLFSTSPEDEEECSEEYKKEMGLEEKRCSIAHFIEGSDIARRSLKCRHRKKSAEELEMECVAVSEVKIEESPISVEIPSIQVSSDDIDIQSEKDTINLKIQTAGLTYSTDKIYLSDKEKVYAARYSCALSETDDEEYVNFENLNRSGTIGNSSSTGPTVIVDPPSPPTEFVEPEQTPPPTASAHEKKGFIAEGIRRLSDTCRRLSAASPILSASAHCSPNPSRRLSNFSLFQAEASDLPKESPLKRTADKKRKLPIINPLVVLPQWPHISELRVVSKALLAHADALCATAFPSSEKECIDPDIKLHDQCLKEGYLEKVVMNNYFGIGIDAQISLDFHHHREEHPEKCKSRARNYMWYGVLGSKQWLQKTCKNLEQRVILECDGVRIPLPSLEGLVIMNITSFMGGINFWGGNKPDDIFLAPNSDDGILEVVAVFGTMQMAASRFLKLQHHRIAQCTSIKITITGDEGVAVQVDGEAWVQPPGIIRIVHKNRIRTLCRNKSLETSLKAWEEKQKAMKSSSQNALHSPLTKQLSIFSEEEYNIMLGFIEAVAALVKSAKLLIVRHPEIEADLYDLAESVATNMERVHPGGKILPTDELRPVVTELVISAQKLYEETCALVKHKNLQMAPEIESQLNNAISSLETELKKCSFFETSTRAMLVFFRLSSPDEQEKKAAGHRKGSAFWQRFRRGSGISTSRSGRREIQAWGVTEVGNWLESLQMSEYVEAFATHDIRGRELLTLTRRDLKDLGVTKVGHVKRILLALKDLNP